MKVEDGNSVYDSRENCNAIIETQTNTLFLGCKNTRIPSSVTRIGEDAFILFNLTSITIPNGVTHINANAFRGCTGLTSVIIPNSMIRIGADAFWGCHLENIIAKGCETDFGSSTFSDASLRHAIVYVPAGKRWDFIYEGGWGLFNNIREIAMEEGELSQTKAYSLVCTDDFTCATYDAVNGEVSSVRSLYDVDEDNTMNGWQVIKQAGNSYLYNIGMRQYASFGPDRAITLSELPVALSIRDSEEGLMLCGQNSHWGFVVNDRLKVDKYPTSIEGISFTSEQNSYYSLDGRRMSKPHHGISIVRSGNGRVKKVMMK